MIVCWFYWIENSSRVVRLCFGDASHLHTPTYAHNTVSVIMGVWSGPKLILFFRSLYQGHYYLLYFLKFPLKWEIKKNIIIYIRVSTSIITFAVQYFLFIVFHNVFYTIPIIEFPLKWEIHNNIMIYIY
jgi:hypothetical protein